MTSKALIGSPLSIKYSSCMFLFAVFMISAKPPCPKHSKVRLYSHVTGESRRQSVEIIASSCEFHPVTPQSTKVGSFALICGYVSIPFLPRCFYISPSSLFLWATLSLSSYFSNFTPVYHIVWKMAEKPASIASTTPSSSWKGWLWDSADVSKEERRFLLKVGCLAMLSSIKDFLI